VSSEFKAEVRENIARIGADAEFARTSKEWTIRSSQLKYSYNFEWLGLPIIQLPQDIVAMQELIWRIKPDVIVETGIARGGSTVFYASLLKLIGKGKVVSVEYDLREGNRRALCDHPMFEFIELIDGDSIADSTLAEVKSHIKPDDIVLVCLDSNHTHDHVMSELNLYSPLVTLGSYIVVFDTVVALLPEPEVKTRPWGRDDNPLTAVRAFLGQNAAFAVDEDLKRKLGVSYAPEGYLERVR
jgi:cephalosporin hydroxylase